MSAPPAASTCAAPTTRPTTPCRPGERYGFIYEINYLRCIHCDLCVEACPTEAITESKLFEFSFTNREDAIYTKAELVVADDGRPQQLPWEDWTDIDDVAPLTSAWMRATAPSGSAAYEGRVQWAGELGLRRAPARAGPVGARRRGRHGPRPTPSSAIRASPGATTPPTRPRAATQAARPTATTTATTATRRRSAPLMVELFVFVVAGAACLAGALGVILSENPVHAALSLVGTLFGIAVLFVAQEANFLAAVQVIVYAGAIVVLFLFVIMLLGVDQADDLRVEPLVGQRAAAAVLSLGVLALAVGALASTGYEVTGVVGELDEQVPDIERLGASLFTDYLYAFEIMSVLLVIAVVGAVLLARRTTAPEIIDPGQHERAEAVAERIEAAERRAYGDGDGEVPVPSVLADEPAESEEAQA